MPPREDWDILKSLLRATKSSHPDYTQIEVPALAFYAIPDHCPDVPSDADENKRNQIDS
jgi:hypothetical protein